MLARALVVVAGLAGAFAAAQFPAFSQQYTQRLGGAVDALAVVVSDFDASAAAVGLDRLAALAQMQGTAFLDRRRSDMTRTIARYEKLSTDRALLAQLGPFMRAYRAIRLTDAEIARGTWASFRPAVPIGVPAFIFACAGFAVASFAAGLCTKVMRRSGRRPSMAA